MQACNAVFEVSLEKARPVHLDLQWKTLFFKGIVEKVEVGGNGFGVTDGAPGLESGAVVNHIEQRVCGVAVAKPAFRDGIQLPEFPNRLALPSAEVGGAPLARARARPVRCGWPSGALASARF